MRATPEWEGQNIYLKQSQFNPQKTGIGELITIFWTKNDPPGF